MRHTNEEDTNVDATSVHRTTKTAGIHMKTDEISVFVNEHGQSTPILIVATAGVDDREYAALYDTKTQKKYAVEVVRTKGHIKEFRDLDGPDQDEEWAVISNFFLKARTYEKYRIDTWITNTRLKQKLSLGKVPPPHVKMKRSGKM